MGNNIKSSSNFYMSLSSVINFSFFLGNEWDKFVYVVGDEKWNC